MQFLTRLLNTKRPTEQQLLDIATLLALVPHLFVLKSFMFVYLFVFLLYMRKSEINTKDTFALLLIGLVSISLSFFSSYNFSNFSRMQFFVSLISSLLILAFTLQRVTHKINSYLIATPAMLMLLSFFFFNTIQMLIYSIVTFFIFVLLSIWVRMDAPLKEVLKFNSVLFLLSLPAVVVMFIAFPRIAFDKADFGFRGDNYWQSGYDGAMYVNDDEFRGSKKTVFEIAFQNGFPPQERLYFRGSTLYMQSKNRWNEVKNPPKEKLSAVDGVLTYDVIMYPQGTKWLYPLDVPITAPKHTRLKGDYTLESKKSIYGVKKYRMNSALNYKLTSDNLLNAVNIKMSEYPKMTKALGYIQEQNLTKKQRADALVKFFFAQNLAYTTKPNKIDKEHPAESFLFEAKEGYCVHYASSFAIAAKVLGIPSRVVTGYKADYGGRVENYLMVKQEDAHAWVELYFEKSGWKRYDPTATAVVNLDVLRKEKKFIDSVLFQKLNLQYMYVKYLINNWILGFDRLKQMNILKSLVEDTLYLLKFIFSILALIFVSLLLVYFIRNAKPKDRGEKVIADFLNTLAKKGVQKETNETMQSFLQRAQKELDISLEDISKEYHLYKYANKSESLLRLEEAIKELKAKL